MTDQAHSLRKKAWEQNRKATYLSISSGKGGVGKTNFAVNLACLLAQLGKKVLVFDADLGLANVDILLNISVSASIRKYLTGEVGLNDIIKRNVYGVDVIPASSGFVELSNLSEQEHEKLLDIFVLLDGQYDFILFDTGAGISENVIRFASVADMVIVLTVPEPTAITDAYAFMKVVHFQYGIQEIHFVLNRVDDVAGVKGIFESMKNVAQKFLNVELSLLGYLREDKTLIKSVRNQKPVCILAPTASYVKDLLPIAKKISGQLELEQKKQNLYEKLKGVFK
ncbi:MinD/ParA family protein [Seleniivibrio sp.]|uniref:MinD/ParA family protein n=1 Tax=Seleniivibrio sp. TaxID=2898801 RepID=UPI0025E56B9B|nr:MinD/ParA family protein [Seleniivibrio sp.]MCD8553918.1 MinD/ParA family protein [Seleniivibrio sp.]